jgi:hypothetical protein
MVLVCLWLLFLPLFSFSSLSVQGQEPIVRVQSHFVGFNGEWRQIETTFAFYENGSILTRNSLGSEFYLPPPMFVPDVPWSVVLKENATTVEQVFFVNGTDKKGDVQTLNLVVSFDFSVLDEGAKITMAGNTTDHNSEVEYEFKSPKGQVPQALKLRDTADFNSIREELRIYENETVACTIGSLKFDWSDIVGVTAFVFNVVKLKIKFKEAFNLDPALVSVVGDSYATYHTFQRKTVEAQGRIWVFYKNTEVCYRSSIDGGATWSSEQVAYDVSGALNEMTVEVKNNYAHLVLNDNGELIYERGLLNTDGTVSWSSSYHVAVGSVLYSSVAVDSDGYPYVSYHDGKDNHFYVGKSSANDGSWVNASGFPVQLTGSTSAYWRGSIVSLSSSQIYAVYSKGNYLGSADVWRGRLYNGSDWETEETISVSQTSTNWMHSLVSDSSDNLYLQFNQGLWSDNILRIKLGGNWQDEETICSNDFGYCGGLALNGTDVYCFMQKTGAGIYYRQRTTAGTWDTIVFQVSDASIHTDTLTPYETAENDRIGFVWTTTHNEVKFSKISTVPKPLEPSEIGDKGPTQGQEAPKEQEQPPAVAEPFDWSGIASLGLYGIIGGVASIAVVGIVNRLPKSKRVPTGRSKGTNKVPNGYKGRKKQR